MDEQQDIKLGGLNINFPYEPYGIQKAMLSKIAVTLTNKEHSLIESPTGTGKTLVLLCASLAWQLESKNNREPLVSARFKKKLAQDRLEMLRNRPCSCGRRPNGSELDELKEAKGKTKTLKNGMRDDIDLNKLGVQSTDPIVEEGKSPYFAKKFQSDKLDKRPNKNQDPDFITIDSDDEEPIVKKVKQDPQDPDITIIDDDIQAIKPLSDLKNLATKDNTDLSQGMCKNCRAIEIEDAFLEEMGEFGTKVKVGKVPRIYYGTRTHKQITQVVRELKKTKYKRDLRMCILSSRDRTCVNDEVVDLPNRNDKCQELVKNKSSSNSKKDSSSETCRFYKESNSMIVDFEAIYDEFKKEAWDIEDAVSFGKANCLCPYYGLRSMQEQADITFCPYNYLLDPNIRKALNINLHNAVIIFDEAHNIEDICRDSASFIINTSQIDDILASINIASQHYLQGSTVRDAYDFFRNLFTDIKAFLVKFEFDDRDTTRDGDCLSRHIMPHLDMLNALERMNIGLKSLATIKEHLRSLRGEDEESGEKARSNSDDAKDAALNANELQSITQLTNTLDFMFGRNAKFSADFRMIISKHLERVKPANFRGANRLSNGDVHMFQLSLMCMNPGVAFEKIHDSAWSVIVASGTLAPIESLKTELGCNFAQVFEGSHVIGEDRIFAAILSQGPNRIDLNCAYNNSLKLEFQDEVGIIVRDVCKAVPNGVLVFFPSYDRMENLYQRWFAKGYMTDIEKSGKKVFREQKSYTAAKFEQELGKYHKNAKGKGALLFAVFRGKVSEGIDFSDAAARAVITIGIPYPNVKEITVNLKREYNDNARKMKPHLMVGSEWYAAQAFRALNQALGRCIRHKSDWGAILMIDSRLKQGTSMNNISKWIRRVVMTPQDYPRLKESLQDFVARLSEE